MPTAQLTPDLEICYESFGPDDAPPVLLVMGLGAQMTLWTPGFISELLGRGFRVIRYDNRDVGLSSKTEGEPPDVISLMTRAMAGETVEAPYSLSDMAADGMALLDHLGIDRAHIVGASMGGMIAQTMAIDHPERVHTLTSIMSMPGNPEVGQPEPEAMAVLMSPPLDGRDANVESSVAASKVICGPLFDEEEARARAREAYDRCFHPIGVAFHMGAIMASGDRTEALGQLDVPTLVIHGRHDTLVTPSGGEATAAAIPGADLMMLGQMGHDMPKLYWPIIADAVFELTTR